MSIRLDGRGISMDLPQTWEGRIGLRQAAVDGFRPGGLAADRLTRSGLVAGREGWAGETTHPLVHLANFALPGDRGDFGSGAVDVMGSAGILLALVEYGPECAGTALFPEMDFPQPLPNQFDPNTLQRRILGQYGYQRFCTVGGRAFCVYIVIGSSSALSPMSAQAREVLASTAIEAR